MEINIDIYRHLKKAEIESAAVERTAELLESYSAAEIIVSLKRLEHFIDSIYEIVRPKITVRGKDDIAGAEISEYQIKHYTYNSPTLERLEAEREEIVKNIKDYKRALELNSAQIVDSQTGQIENAVLTEVNTQFRVKLL